MKNILLIFVCLLLGASALRAQNIAIGERMPELRISTWLADHQPDAAPFTYIEFFHPTNPACITSLKRLHDIAEALSGKLRVIVVAQEVDDNTRKLLLSYVSQRIGVGIDDSKKTSASFGVHYVPFGVLTNAKNRALWMGNTLQLTSEIIEKTFQ